MVSARRRSTPARRFFTNSLTTHPEPEPAEVITDRAPALAHVIDELLTAALHNTGQYENNRCEADHGRLKARLRPLRGHYELATHTPPLGRIAAAFDEFAPAI